MAVVCRVHIPSSMTERHGFVKTLAGSVGETVHSVRHRLRMRRSYLVERYELSGCGAVADQLLRIFEAMRRLDNGTYGACLACAMWIDRETLRSEPEATRCQVCALF
jgi:hypothetical protein